MDKARLITKQAESTLKDTISRHAKPQSTRLPVTLQNRILVLQRQVGNGTVQHLMNSGNLLQLNEDPDSDIAQYKQEIVEKAEGVFTLGPFQLKNGVVTHDGKIISAKDLQDFYQDLNEQENFQNRVVKKLQDYIAKHQNDPNDVEYLRSQVYNTLKGQSAGKTTLIYPSKQPLLEWSNLGKIDVKPDNNLFYFWTANLHETAHHDTVEKRFSEKFRSAADDIKESILKRPSIPKDLKDQFKEAKTTQDIVVLIVNNPVHFSMDKKILENEMLRWYEWLNQAVNFAQDDIRAYRVSLAAIKKAKEFIRRALQGTKPQKAPGK